jgi:hypothetical protein
MEFQQQLENLRTHYRDLTEKFKQDVIGEAVGLLRADIENPQLTTPETPDAFMLRANQIGIALLESGLFSVAETLYRILAAQTLEYRDKTGQWRHAGALFANAGTACAAQGDFDKAIIELLKAAKEDEKTYRVDSHNSFAIKGMLEAYFGKPIKDKALLVAQKVNPSIASDNLDALVGNLGTYEYAFLSYVYIAITHEEANTDFPNEFSYLQTLTALRNLSTLLEVSLKTLNGNMEETFHPTLKKLYGAKTWWASFEGQRLSVGATMKSKTSTDIQLKNAIGIITTDDISLFGKSLLVAYIVRNYTAHQMVFSGQLVQSYSHEALAHILNVMVMARNFT